MSLLYVNANSCLGTAWRQLRDKSVVVKGTGTWNGDGAHTFELRATDAGRDLFSIVVKNANGVTVGSVSGSLRGGNIQAKSGQ